MPRSRRGVQTAVIVTRDAYINSDFGTSYATKLFGEEAIASLPEISRGKRKGMKKGMLFWEKCTEGGWVYGGFSGGGVVRPGFVKAWIVVDNKTVMETFYPSFEKKQEREAEEAAQRAKYLAEQEIEFAGMAMDDFETEFAAISVTGNTLKLLLWTAQFGIDKKAQA